MGKLLKYEIRKGLAVKLILLGITALLELVFLIGLWGDNERMLATGTLFLTFTAVTGITVAGLARYIRASLDPMRPGKLRLVDVMHTSPGARMPS